MHSYWPMGSHSYLGMATGSSASRLMIEVQIHTNHHCENLPTDRLFLWERQRQLCCPKLSSAGRIFCHLTAPTCQHDCLLITPLKQASAVPGGAKQKHLCTVEEHVVHDRVPGNAERQTAGQWRPLDRSKDLRRKYSRYYHKYGCGQRETTVSFRACAL